ncbi:FkbM family methyltransferase, partial [Pelagibacteraceae bacterium]|nr:FkbM family methyltransferase [Pelagibacteraceae bacterium]
VLYKKISENFVKNNRTALHIGCHYGFKTKILSKLFDTVHAFDFDNKINKFLKRNIKKFNLSNVEIHSFGLGDENKNVDATDFIERKNIYGPLSNHVVENINGPYFVKKLDDLNISNIDLMIIDTEGYELKVLNGSINTIKQYYPAIILEVHKKKDLTSRYGYNKFENIKFLTDIGYKARGYINREDILLVYE